MIERKPLFREVHNRYVCRAQCGQNHGVLTMRRLYLDYNASTPIDAAVAAAMRPFLEDHYGNPSSGHWASIEVKAALEVARGQVAALLGCHDDEIVFTSGGSEADNLALKGVFFALREKGDHIITTRIEHPAIIEPCRFLERLGARVSYLSVDGTARIDPSSLRQAITWSPPPNDIISRTKSFVRLTPFAAGSRNLP
jgi:cysteine desulfurase